MKDFRIEDNPTMSLFKGDSGTGKSIAAGSYPGPIYFGDIDKRIRAVVEFYRGIRTDIEWDTYLKYNDFADKMDEFINHCPYKTIVIPDSITNLSTMMINESVALRGTGKGSKVIGNTPVTTWDDFNVETRKFQVLLDALKRICIEQKVYVISIAHIVTGFKTNAKTGATKIDQKIVTSGPTIAAQIPTMFDEIYHFYTEAGIDSSIFKVRTYNDGIDFARSSFRAMPGEIEWTNSMFYNQIKPYFGEHKSDTQIIEDKKGNNESIVTYGDDLSITEGQK